MQSLDIFACPLTGEPPCLDRAAGCAAGAEARYAIEDNAIRRNPELQNGHRSLVRILVPVVVPRAMKRGRRDPRLLDRLEHLVQRLRLDRLFLGCQMHLLEKPA